MVGSSTELSTGLAGFDKVLKGLLPGDNIVWQVSSIADYHAFVKPYCQHARAAGKKLIYFRFAKHEELVCAEEGAEIHELHPEEGFETFISGIHSVIEASGRGAFYVFDCLSDLVVDWYSDQMLGNFFMLTCPYLYDLETIAYFALLRNYHSSQAVTPIAETTQLLLDIYRHKGKLYVHPLKVQQRYSPTMHMLHVWDGNEFHTVTDSATIAEIMAGGQWSGMEGDGSRLGIWTRTFLQAEEIAESFRQGEPPPPEAKEYFHRLVRMAISRDERVLRLVSSYLDLRDILNIRKRMIGTGLIGGKAVGMLLSRAILKHTDKRLADLLETHDSFFIGSDVFYTFLVRNGVWWVREQQRNPETFLEGAVKARQRILTGSFPDYITRQFGVMLDYFGQSPIIVRSSSLLEDNFGNSFAGKYESVFCPNQGPRERRIEDFVAAVRSIYASTMSERALNYRANRGLLDKDEQMALLVMRVSGALYGKSFFPQTAGVGFSFNPYVWSKYIDPQAGVLRLVFGLGTRAVDRTDDDYTRLVALNAPERRPESSFDQVKRHAQRKVDVLDLEANHLTSMDFADVVHETPGLPMDLFASRDAEVERAAAERGRSDVVSWVLTFDRLLSDTDFVKDMREILRVLHYAYNYPVDIEFTANFQKDGSYKVNLVQCRPLQVKEGGTVLDAPTGVAKEDKIMEARGAVIGQSRLINIDRMIYVIPQTYGELPVNDRYAVARLIGEIVHLKRKPTQETLMALGPGRWGTSTPSLGVPVTFAEINKVSVLCEIVAMRDDLVPDVSLGTHFLNELVEMDMLYLALFPKQGDSFLNSKLLDGVKNKLTEYLPGASKWQKVVKVIDAVEFAKGGVVKLYANALEQKVICYIEKGSKR